MRPEEDKDIKVFHPSNEKKEQAEESTDLSQDILHAVQELDAQRSNGNLRRADRQAEQGKHQRRSKRGAKRTGAVFQRENLLKFDSEVVSAPGGKICKQK